MDLQRFLGLYIAETHEHVRLLHASLLAMETRPDGTALDEAFRAAHTLKSLSAAMGFDAVAELAHSLEDRLAELRAGGGVADPDAVDAMLAEADRIEEAIALAVAAPVAAPACAVPSAASPGASPAASPAGAEPEAARTQARSPGAGTTGTQLGSQLAGEAGVAPTVRALTVRLRRDAPLKPVRAMLIMRALDACDGVLGSEPAEFGEMFEGEFRVLLAGGADVDAACAAIRGAGEVDTVEVVDGASGAPPEAPAGARPALQAPRQLRVDAERLDAIAEDIGELTLILGRLQPARGLPAQATDAIDRLVKVADRLQHDVMRLRMVPVRQAFERLPRVVRDAARALGRDVELVLEGDDVELDRAILDEIVEPLVHLLRNAVAHGIEPAEARLAAGKPVRGRVTVRAERERSSVRIAVSDDGRGIRGDRLIERARAAGLPDAGRDALDDDGLLRLLSRPGMSTSDSVTGLAGRGVGMDVVVSRVRGMGGAIGLSTEPGTGTTFTMRLPISLALTPALRVRVGGEDYAIPLTHIAEAVDLQDPGAVSVTVRGERVPLVRLDALLSVGGSDGAQAAVIAGTGSRRAALAVDELVGREQILVKSFDTAAGTLPYFSGATLLADGRPALVLDPLSVIPG